jgi:predicted DNA binding protein
MSEKQYPMERVYADYANSMKALGNQARLEIKATTKIDYSSSAKATYINEVKSLNAKLNNALLNTTRERQATRLANAEVKAKQQAYKEEHGVDMKPGDLRKIKQRAMSKYRQEVQAVSRRDRNIDITDREWEAIQAGAVSETTLKKILNNTDVDKLRERATPRTTSTLSSAQVNRIKAYSASNYTIGEIAKKLGVSTSTVSKYLKGKE